MSTSTSNPYDILLAGVYAGFLLAAILNGLLLRIYGLKGLPIGILTNTVMHISFLEGAEYIDRGQNPPITQIIIAAIYFILLTSICTWFIYLAMKKKRRSPEFVSSLNLFLCSVFFWELFIPALFVLIVLLIPSREERQV